ncbi:thylakoid lumenal 17.4 kDa protein, chloroplastic-like [Ananas comosus]|uniref:Thylakoid lumenal 17.4 kDa protein, chloroplastic-like n=1 Tax=Ananas comosus TaxID=4615 RepID=A0A6P5FNJ3_ANACO|nr:thylakoid lumenal 17.4 kDa protein, chloroplastic-like [Ananas comosus]
MGKWRVEYEEEEEEEEKYSNKKSATNQLKMASFCVPGAGSSLRPSLSSSSSSASRIPLSRPRNRIQCASIEERSSGLEESAAAAAASSSKGMRSFACGLLAAWAITAASPAAAANQRLPPLSTEPNRCERAFVGNTIGQANGVYDKPIDLRFCDYTNEKSNLKGKSLAAALMSDAKFDGADMSEVVMSKAYAVGASFKGVDFTNAVIDRVNFEKADLQGAIFKNTVLSGSTFNDANLKDAVFEDTIIGYIDLQKLCTNTTISAEGRAELGCR